MGKQARTICVTDCLLVGEAVCDCADAFACGLAHGVMGGRNLRFRKLVERALHRAQQQCDLLDGGQGRVLGLTQYGAHGGATRQPRARGVIEARTKTREAFELLELRQRDAQIGGELICTIW